MSLASDLRASPFTVEEFSDLVCSAFNLHDVALASPSPRPILSLTPPSPPAPALPETEQENSSSSRDNETDDEHQRLRSPSLDDGSPHLSQSVRRSRSRTITALRVLHQVRTRASAFVLGPRAPSVSRSSPSPVPFEPIPPLSISPTLLSTPIIPARTPSPLSMVDLNLDRQTSRPRSRADSLPRPRFFKRETTPPPLPGRHARPNTSAGPRSASPGLRSFFDDSPGKARRAYSRPSTSASTVHPLSRVTTTSSADAVLSTDGLPSFFEDTGYQVSKPPIPNYTRPSMPAGAGSQRIHARLPPLRKAKSGGYGLFSRGSRKDNPKISSENAPPGLDYGDSMMWGTQHDGRAPSPFTNPRDVPPVPVALKPPMRDSLEDLDAPLPPSYVFERRGSAASNSTASTRSTSSLSSRISSIVGIFPSKMRMHARSKLNLSISTGPDPASAHSSPSTLSSLSTPTTPVSPTSMFPRSQPYVFPGVADFHSRDNSFAETEQDSLALGRVLTPEADPFAKAEIVVPLEGTPRPPTPPVSRRASAQTSPPVALHRSPTWDEERVRAIVAPLKRTRNSLPASPVSSASTFPSTCSVYRGREPSPFAQSPPTPKRNGPPSAWSPFSTPAGSSPSQRSSSTPPSSPDRPKSSPAKAARRRTSGSPPSPTMSAFPLPPRTIPLPAFPAPDRALPSPPLPSPPAPPVPPKDISFSRVQRAHKSLPPSPRPLESPSGSPSSVLSYRDTSYVPRRAGDRQLTLLPLGTSIRDVFPDVYAGADDEVRLMQSCDLSSSSLGEPWPGCGSSGGWPIPSTLSPGWEIRPVTRRRSADSVSTVTGSPTSSALHEAARGWNSETSTVSGRHLALEVDALSIGAASSTVLPAFEASADGDSDCCSSAVSLSTFYTARSHLDPDSPAQVDSPVVGFRMGLGA
ncbi:hypothetical protein BV20DRAFT_555923 [Pilatotrama ljubarskyi]|nr:hypothetical protein BV20DRAFT_555923 [Pilatotrama ljubarskyi]